MKNLLNPEEIQALQRAEFLLRRIAEGDHKAMENATPAAHDIRMLMRRHFIPLADEESQLSQKKLYEAIPWGKSLLEERYRGYFAITLRDLQEKKT